MLSGVKRLALLVLLAACQCAPSKQDLAPYRIGVPPDIQPILAGAPRGNMGPADMVSLRPYDRARDLEILLFSSGSRAFDGIVLPGRSVPILRPWIDAFPAEWLKDVRSDVAESLLEKQGALALPWTLDGALVVYRSDLWRELRLPPPASLAAVREAALSLRSRKPEMGSPVVSDLPPDQLFWDLAWSFEGRSTPEIYSYPKLHALRFIREFRLGGTQSGSTAGAEAMARGEAALLFTGQAGAERLLGSSPAGTRRFAVAVIPASGGVAHCIYNGLCLARPQGSRLQGDNWATFLSRPFQSYLASKGWPGVLSKGEQGELGPFGAVFGKTVFHAAPDIGEGGDEAVSGAILDVTEGSIDAEAALRRAQARVEQRRSP